MGSLEISSSLLMLLMVLMMKVSIVLSWSYYCRAFPQIKIVQKNVQLKVKQSVSLSLENVK